MVGEQVDARVSGWAVMGSQLLGAGLVVSGSPPNYLEMSEGAIVAGKLYWTDQALHTTRFIPSYVARFATPGEQRTEAKEAVIRVATIEVVQDETKKTLDRIRSLPFDWNGQGSEPPNTLSLSIAAGVLSLLRQRQMKTDRVAASAEGGVGICFKRRAKYSDIECFNTGEIWALTSTRPGRPRSWRVPRTETGIRAALDEIGAFLK